MGWCLIQGGIVIPLVAYAERNWYNKPRLGGPLVSRTDLTFTCSFIFVCAFLYELRMAKNERLKTAQELGDPDRTKSNTSL